MQYLRGFVPWIAYGVIANWGWQWGALSAFAISVALLLADRKAGVRADAQILEISAALFFGLLSVVAFLVPDSGIDAYDSALAFGWLAVTAWLSLIIGKPFTLGIAKREVPQEHWHTPQFLRINKVITTAWALAFTVTCAAVAIVFMAKLGDTADLVAQVLGFVAPITFTNWYRERAASVIGAEGDHGR